MSTERVHLQSCMERLVGVQDRMYKLHNKLTKVSKATSPDNCKKPTGRLSLAAQRPQTSSSPASPNPRHPLWPANLFHSAEEYWAERAKVAEYKVEICPYTDDWVNAFSRYSQLLVQATQDYNGLKAPPFRADNVFHIGSTSIVDCPAKPVIDVMICMNSAAGSFRSSVLQAWTLSAKCPELNFDIGFCDESKEWAMFQIVKSTALERGCFEINVHLYPGDEKGSRAQEKLELVAYLRSPAGNDDMKEYVDIKMQLARIVKTGVLEPSHYSTSKNMIVGKVLRNAQTWVKQQNLNMQSLMLLCRYTKDEHLRANYH